MNQIPHIRRAALAPAATYLAERGVPIHRYLRRASCRSLHPRIWKRSYRFINVRLPRHGCSREGIHDLGYRIAGNLGIESLGVYGRLIAKSLTLHDSIEISIELIPSYNSGQQVWMERHGDQVRYCQRRVENLPQDRIREPCLNTLSGGILIRPSPDREQSGTRFRATRRPPQLAHPWLACAHRSHRLEHFRSPAADSSLCHFDDKLPGPARSRPVLKCASDRLAECLCECAFIAARIGFRPDVYRLRRHAEHAKAFGAPFAVLLLNPRASCRIEQMGTIRGLYAVTDAQNVIQGTLGDESALTLGIGR